MLTENTFVYGYREQIKQNISKTYNFVLIVASYSADRKQNCKIPHHVFNFSFSLLQAFLTGNSFFLSLFYTRVVI